MKLLPISAIQVAQNRQRRLFDASKLHEFSDGIQTRGLLHPIILRVVGDQYFLVAGERRLRAITDIAALGGVYKHDGQTIKPGFIPYTLFDDLDPLAAEEAELEENIHREDLTWQERALAHARLADLRTKQAAAAGLPPPSVAELARELDPEGTASRTDGNLGDYQAKLRRQIIVAKHLDNPAIAGAATIKEAFKALKREDTAARNKKLGEQVGKTFTADMHTLVNDDSFQWLQGHMAESFDVILTDPPYGMGADEFGDSGGLTAGAHGYADTPDLFLSIMNWFPVESFRVAKAQAHLYVFCDIGWFQFLKEKLVEAGWNVFRTPLIWYKKSGMRAPWPEQGPQRKYETILYAVKSKRRVLKMAGDVLDFPPDANLGHVAQKPVALFQELLSRSVLPGQSVLDPFMGSGPIIEAAHVLKCQATGIELDQASYGIAVARLERLKAQQALDLGVGLGDPFGLASSRPEGTPDLDPTHQGF